MSERATPEMIRAGQIAGYGVATLAVERILVAALAVAPEHPAVAMLRQFEKDRGGATPNWCVCCQKLIGHTPDCALAKLIEVKS